MVKNYLILGFGLTGKSVFNFLAKKHINQAITVTIFDEKVTDIYALLPNLSSNVTINFIRSVSDIKFESKIDLAIVSPGINPKKYHDLLVNKLKIRLISDIQLFLDEIYQDKQTSYIYSITGTNGKSTVCALLYFLLDKNKAVGNQVLLGGNFGVPAVDLVKSADPDQATATTYEYVLELSSYQLELTDCLHSLVAVCLNITPDHLVWHNGMENYINAKLKIYKDSKFDIINFDDKLLLGQYISKVWPKKRKLSEVIFYSNITSYHQISLELKLLLQDDGSSFTLITIENNEDKSYISFDNQKILWVETLPFILKTKHNLSNFLAVLGMLFAKNKSAGYKKNINDYMIAYQQSLQQFKGLPYRCEFVTDFNQIKVFNDSKATNLNATVTALDSMTKEVENKLWLILGGIVKEDIEIAASRQEFINCLNINRHKIAGIIICSADNNSKSKFIDLIQSANTGSDIILKIVDEFSNLVPLVFQQAEPGDYVLFSPGGASFDNFANYMERGAKFNLYVKDYVSAN